VTHDQTARRAAGGGLRPYRLRAVLFDFDGTLTRPGALDFDAIKRQIGCPPERFVLEYVEALAAGEQRDAARAALELFELEGAAGSRPNDGAEELVRRVRAAGLGVGVLTRNGHAAVSRALQQFAAPPLFDVVLTRDDDIAPKPAPDGVRHACAALGVDPAETLVVGDFLLDVQAGNAAGAMTAYLTNGAAAAEGGGEAGLAAQAAAEADVVVHDLAELMGVIELGLPLPAGKLPNELLARHLGELAPGPGVVVGPGVGEDVAAFDVTNDELIVVHGDPITLATVGDVGRAAVLVNANDIAAAGAEPRWLFTTVLLPPGTTGSAALALLDDIARAAASEGIALGGGHTEVTAAVARPVVSATAIGVVRRAGLRDKRGARSGDQLILTKGVAVEGTALLAAELRERLLGLGMSREELDACERLSQRTSIVPEARLAAGFAGVRAMHDVTEGGLATALRELAVATGRGVTVDAEAVAVLPETRRLCALLGADPLGLIGSGALLVCCAPDEAAALLAALQAAGIAAAVIGRLGEQGAGVSALSRGRPAPWPSFATDEAARLLAKADAARE
jgi:hydrogenase expression/formation protein HypE